MGLPELWAAFTASLPQIKDAWPTVSGLVIVALVVGWITGRFMYGQRIEDLKTSAQTLRDRLALRDEQIAASASPDEARAMIAALENRLAALEPYGIAKERAAAMLEVLRRYKGAIFITQDVSGPDALHLFNQVAGLFEQAGWNLERRQGILGIQNPPDCGVTLIRDASLKDSELVQTIRDALNVAHLDVMEREPLPSGAAVPHLAFSSRDRNYVPAARWG
jgi:hypothetical protein